MTKLIIDAVLIGGSVTVAMWLPVALSSSTSRIERLFSRGMVFWGALMVCAGILIKEMMV